MKEAKYFIAIFLLVTINACTQPVEIKSPPGYDLNKPEVFEMPAALQEISGIAFKSDNADTVYTQQDEDGKIFVLKPGDKEARVIKFGKKGDYEDIGIYGDTVVMMKSTGTLYLFSLTEVIDGEAVNVREINGYIPPGEYEAMYVDEKDGTIYLLCKECPFDKKGTIVTGYRIKVSSSEGNITSGFNINEKEIEVLNGGNKIKFKPSAITKNRETNEWYILSSVNKMLVVADEAWKVKSVYPLQPAPVFKQPEGIAFDKDRNLYISNESAGIGAGTILKFAYKKNN